MARANPHLRSLRIFDPDVDLAIDEEPISGKGKKTASTSEDFMADPLLSLAGESAAAEEPEQTSPSGKASAGPGSAKQPPPKTDRTQAEAAQPAHADASFDEDLGGKVVEL